MNMANPVGFQAAGLFPEQSTVNASVPRYSFSKQAVLDQFNRQYAEQGGVEKKPYGVWQKIGKGLISGGIGAGIGALLAYGLKGSAGRGALIGALVGAFTSIFLMFRKNVDTIVDNYSNKVRFLNQMKPEQLLITNGSQQSLS